jgi:hypothetical protein
MSYLYHPDREFIVMNRIDNTIPPLTYSVSVLAGQFFATLGSRVFRQPFDPLDDFSQFIFWG